MNDPNGSDATIPDFKKFQQAFQRAREHFLPQEGILGVGHGFKQTAKAATGVYSIIVYVVAKERDKRKIRKEARVEREFEGAPTDVIERGERTERIAAAHDRTFIEPGKLPPTDARGAPRRARPKRRALKVGETAVVFYDDGHDAKLTDVLSEATAYQCFRDVWEEDGFDFVTFFVDSDSGLPGDATYHYGVYNDTEGIGYVPGGTQASPFSRRPHFGSSRLLGCNFVEMANWQRPEVLLHESAHAWTAYAHFKLPPSPYNYLGLLMRDGALGGLEHWGSCFHDDLSPMDYDDPPLRWEKDDKNRYRKKPMTSAEFRFCDLDLYLMGLIPPSEVRPFLVLRKSYRPGADFHVPRWKLTVENIELAHGKRAPACSTSSSRPPQVFRHAFVLLTKREGSSAELRGMGKRVDQTRAAFVEMFSKATGGRARMDTGLAGPSDMESISA